MVITIQFQTAVYEEQLVARFGGARLFRNLDGKYFLQGGTVEEQSEALEWIAMFLHYVVPEVLVSEPGHPEKSPGSVPKEQNSGSSHRGTRLPPKRYGRS